MLKSFILILVYVSFMNLGAVEHTNDSNQFRVKIYALGRFVDNAVFYTDVYDYNLDTNSIMEDVNHAVYVSDKKSGKVHAYFYKDTNMVKLPETCQTYFSANNKEVNDSIIFIPVLLLTFERDNDCESIDTIEMDAYKRIRIKCEKNINVLGYSPVPYNKSSNFYKLYSVNVCLMNFVLSALPEDLNYNWRLSTEEAMNKKWFNGD